MLVNQIAYAPCLASPAAPQKVKNEQESQPIFQKQIVTCPEFFSITSKHLRRTFDIVMADQIVGDSSRCLPDLALVVSHCAPYRRWVENADKET